MTHVMIGLKSCNQAYVRRWHVNEKVQGKGETETLLSKWSKGTLSLSLRNQSNKKSNRKPFSVSVLIDSLLKTILKKVITYSVILIDDDFLLEDDFNILKIDTKCAKISYNDFKI